jgi:hypothetical protein
MIRQSLPGKSSILGLPRSRGDETESNQSAQFLSKRDEPILEPHRDNLDLKEPMAFLGFDKSYVRLIREAMYTDFEVMYCNYEKTQTRRTAMRVLNEIDACDPLLTLWKGNRN